MTRTSEDPLLKYNQTSEELKEEEEPVDDGSQGDVNSVSQTFYFALNFSTQVWKFK